MRVNSAVEWLAKSLREICSLILLFMGSVAPLLLILLKKIIHSYEPYFTSVGARMPLPMRLINQMSDQWIYLLWVIVVITLLALVFLEEYEARIKKANRSIPGSPEMLAVAIIAFVITLLILEQPFISACQQNVENSESGDMMLRHLQRYHQKAG